MAETKPDTPVQTNAGAQNTIVIILFALLILVGAILVLNMSSRDGSSQQDRLTELQLRVEQKENELRAKGYDLPAQSESIEDLASRISKDALSLRASAEQLQATLLNKENELRKVQSELQASITMYERQGVETSKLRTQLSQLQGQQQQTASLQQQVANLQAQVTDKNKQIEELGSRPDGSQYLEVNKELNTALLKNKELEVKVAELTSLNNSMISQSEVQQMKDQLAKLTPENEALKLDIQRLRAEINREQLYVQSADQLLPNSAKLYRELEKLEGLDQDQLKAAYVRIGEQLNARVIKDVHFKTGDSIVGFSDTADIKDRLADINPESNLLIVGYASQTGDADQNRSLSAQRSATTASVVHHLLGEKGNVHAVYLGQTARFSATAEENQICEIWEISK